MSRLDYPLNAGAFLLYAAAVQIVVMPTVARHVTTEAFALLVLFFAVYSVLGNAVGEELGNALLVRSDSYRSGAQSRIGDAAILLVLGVAVGGCLGVLVLALLGWPAELLLIGFFSLSLGICRAFFLSMLRANRRFASILLSQAVYAGSAAVLSVFISEIADPVLVFLVADGISLLVSGVALICAVALSKRRLELPSRRSPILRETTQVYVNFAASSMAKVVSLPIGPLAGVLLSRMSGLAASARHLYANRALRSVVPVFLVTFALATGASFIGVRLFYPQFRDDVVPLLIPVGLAASAGAVVTVTRPILMRFYPSGRLLRINLVYAAVLIIFCLALLRAGLIGFAWAIVTARVMQAAGYVVALFFVRRDTVEDG